MNFSVIHQSIQFNVFSYFICNILNQPFIPVQIQVNMYAYSSEDINAFCQQGSHSYIMYVFVCLSLHVYTKTLRCDIQYYNIYGYD